VRVMRNMFATSEDAELAYYEALERADLESMMNAWSEDDEIACIHPGGPRLVGHATIRASWQVLFANGPIHARPAHVHTMVGPMVAVHCVVEQVIVARGSTTAIVNVYATNVYFKGPLGWRMILHHASAPPHDQAQTSVSGPSVLH
jgi:ketosteroid isomerase-like protein